MTDAEVDSLAACYLTEARLTRFRQVARSRLRGLTVLCENIADVRNLSACLRSAEIVGASQLHATINTRGGESLRRNAASGASRWIDAVWHGSTEEAVASLKDDGYTLIGTAVDKRAVPFREVELPDKVALCMGPEFGCMSDALQAACDAIVHIPMYGFTESLNLSVAAGILLEDFGHRLRQRDAATLPADDVQQLVRQWCHADLVRKFDDRLPEVIRRHRSGASRR